MPDSGFLTPAPPLPAIAATGKLSVAALNAYPAHVLALYTALAGGWRTQKPICTVAGVDPAAGFSTGVDTVMQWSSAQDTDNMFADVSPFQLTVQTAGWWRLLLQVHWDAATAGLRACKILVNGQDPSANAVASDVRTPPGAGEGTVTACAATARLSVGSTIYGNAWQSSGGAVHLLAGYSGSFLAAEWIAP